MNTTKLIIWLVIFGIVIGIVGTLLTQYVLDHIEISVEFTEDHPYQLKERYQ